MGDVETWIESGSFVQAKSGSGTLRIFLGTLGQRIALFRTELRRGTTGADFENLFLVVILFAGEHIRANESFDFEDVDRRLARFEELCGG